jgi:hypothetical protein
MPDMHLAVTSIEMMEPTEEEIAALEAATLLFAKMQQDVIDAETKLAQDIEAEFQQRKAQRTDKEAEWLQSQALLLGHLAYSNNLYSETDFYKTHQSLKGKQPTSPNIVEKKCQIAYAQFVTSQFGAGDKNWSIRPSKKPQSAAPEIDVEQAAINMDRAISDQLDLAKYGKNMRRAMYDLTHAIGTAVVKGPLNLGKIKKSFVMNPEDGSYSVVYDSEFVPGCSWVNPWFFYPDMTATKMDDCDTTIEEHPWTPRQVKELLYNKGFNAEAITALLKEAPRDNSASDSPRDKDLGGNTQAYKGRYRLLESYWKVPKSFFEARNAVAGIEESFEEDYIFCEVWTCQGKILRIDTPLLDSCKRPPYYVSVWQPDPSSIFGYSIPIKMVPHQYVVEETSKMILDNCEMSALPQAAVNKMMVEPQDGDTYELRGGKVWNLTQYGQNVNQAIQYFYPPNNSEAITQVMSMWERFADEESGIPNIAGGLAGPELGDGATGLAIRKRDATSVLFQKSQGWDDDITDPLIYGVYEFNMLFNPDPSVKGDFEIDVTSSSAALKNELELAKLEKLSVEAAQNPELALVINQDELTKVKLAMMRLPSSKIVKTAEEIAAAREQQASQPNPQVIEMEIKKEELKLKQMELEYKMAQLDLERNQVQRREQWENEERMASIEARNYENSVDAETSRNELDIKYMEMMGRKDVDMAKIDARLQETLMKTEAQKLQTGADTQLRATDLAVKREEMVRRLQMKDKD